MFTNVDMLLYSYYLTFAVSRGAWLLNGPNVTVTFRSGGGKFYQFGLWSEQVRPGSAGCHVDTPLSCQAQDHVGISVFSLPAEHNKGLCGAGLGDSCRGAGKQSIY